MMDRRFSAMDGEAEQDEQYDCITQSILTDDLEYGELHNSFEYNEFDTIIDAFANRRESNSTIPCTEKLEAFCTPQTNA